MDRGQFDGLTKLLATTGSRRASLGALLGACLMGRGLQALAKPGKGQNRRQARRKRRRKNQDGGQNAALPASACGGKQCAAPKPGSTRSDCDFSGRVFAGADQHGSVFRRIDGRRANFDETDNHGSVFAEACLKGATFRGADLSGSSWGDACLIAVDFTGADLSRDAVTFDDAVLCGTIMPDGAVRDDDCPPGVDPENACCADADCGPARVCRDHACVPDPGACAAGQNICHGSQSASCGNQPKCSCVRTTDAETFCGLATACSNCASDEDCAAVTGPGSVCADYSGSQCSCRDTNRRACVGPCEAPCTSDAQCGDFGVCCDGLCRSGDCCTTADCDTNRICENNICVCHGCLSRINNRCETGAAWGQCGADSVRCAACASGQICAAERQTCVSCEQGTARRGTFCEIRDDFARFQCAPNCACAASSQHGNTFGACFSGAAYCQRGPEQICEFPSDCVIDGYGTDCILAGDCVEGCRTLCVTRCGAGDEGGPLQLVVLDEDETAG